jgi:hypothetical protein
LQEVHKPEYRLNPGALDGIYYKADKTVKETTERTYDSNNRLVQTTTMRDNGKAELWRYYYERFADGDTNIYLLSRAELDFLGSKVTYHVEYRK